MEFLRKTLAVRTTVLEVKYVRPGSRTKSALLTPAERADDLLKHLTREEKVGQKGGIRGAFRSVNRSVV
jgi:hypothetical protein